MTNRIAFVLALIIIALIILDVTMNASAATMFLLRKLVDAVDYLAFWR